MAKAFISGVDALVLQEKVVDITENGTVEVIPDEGKLLRKVTAKINTPTPKEEQEKVVQINGNGTIDILPDNGMVLSKVTAVVNVEGGSDAPEEPTTPEYSEGLEFGYDDNWFWYAVTGYGTWDGEDLVIPPYTDEGEPIEGIAFEALDNNTKIKSATLPDSMTFIVDDIFNNCPNLTHLYIPYIQQIASICMISSSFKYVQFRDIEMIGGNDFRSCNGAEFDFTQCTSVPTLDSYGAGEEFGTNPTILVPAELYDEWKSATNWTLYADYIVVEGQEEEDESAKILNALIDGSITEIESGVTSVCDYAFYSLDYLTSATFPNATSIGEYAFSVDRKLTSITAPNVTTIKTYAFNNCELLPSVSFPKVTKIESNAFRNCAKCLEFDFSGCTAVPTLQNQNAFSGTSSNAKIKVPAALYDEWIAATNWSTYASKIVAV